MRVLLAIADLTVADQVRVGLDAFPDVEVVAERGPLALELLRAGDVDVLLLAVEPGVAEDAALLENARKDAAGTEIVVLGRDAALAELREEKVRGRIFAALALPLEPVEFFRTIRRLREKRAPARAR